MGGLEQGSGKQGGGERKEVISFPGEEKPRFPPLPGLGPCSLPPLGKPEGAEKASDSESGNSQSQLGHQFTLTLELPINLLWVSVF